MIGLTQKQVAQFREELEADRPAIYFHDDADGLASFLLLYKHFTEGKGIVLKSPQPMSSRLIASANGCDKIFIVDIAQVEQEFIDEAKVPVVWVDHHGPFDVKGATYINSRSIDPERNAPASYLCYQAVKENLWISVVGCIGDWFIPPTAEEFRQKYPDLLPEGVEEPSQALFETEAGRLAKIFNFCLKGNANEAMKYVKTLTRIKSPYEILNKETPQGKFIYKKYEKFEKEYQEIIKDARKTRSKLLFYKAPSDRTAFNSEISNEIIYRYPDRIVMIAREHGGYVKFSVRSSPPVVVRDALEKALSSVDGKGGGHEQACGGMVKAEDWDRFFKEFKKETKSL